MANTEGGLLVIGIDDPEKTKNKGTDRILGIDLDLENFDSIGNEIRKISPPISGIWPSVILEASNKKRVALINIPKVTDQLRTYDNKIWIRQQKSNRFLTPSEIIKYSYARGFEKADHLLVDVDFRLLQTDTYEEWKTSRGISGKTIEEILEKTGLARNENGKIKPTLASVLLFSEYPNDITEYKTSIRVMQFTGNVETIGETPNLIGKPKSINGPLIKQIRDAHEYVLNLLKVGITIPSGFTTKYKLPERVVKEAITNAVIHRDYFMKRDIEVKIFEDRIEVESPGLLPYNITVSNIGKTRSDGYRNDLIIKHLREFPYPPNLDQNEGVRAMRKEMASNNLYFPIYWTYPNLQDSVRVILFNEEAPSEWDKVQHFFKTNKFITNEDARFITNISQRDKMSKLLKKWVKKGLLIAVRPQSGYVKGIKYKLSDTTETNLLANDESK